MLTHIILSAMVVTMTTIFPATDGCVVNYGQASEPRIPLTWDVDFKFPVQNVTSELTFSALGTRTMVSLIVVVYEYDVYECPVVVRQGGKGSTFFLATVTGWKGRSLRVSITMLNATGPNVTTVTKFGSVSPDDVIMHAKTYSRAAIPNKHVIINVSVRKGNTKGFIIRHIGMVDLLSGNSTRSATILEGGVGFNGTIIQLRSEAGKAIKTYVQVLGKMVM